MVQVRWSQEAENDLDEYCAYIARTSSGSQAGLFAGRIHAVVESIRLLPYSGWVAGESFPDCSIPVFRNKHRIIYRVDGDTVRILTIVRGAKRLPNSLS